MPESAAAIVAVSSPNARMSPCDAPALAAGTVCAIAAAAPMNASACPLDSTKPTPVATHGLPITP